MNLQRIIQKIGLNEKQASVYLAALALGQASMTELARKSELKRPTTYLTVESLQILGLLSETKKNKRMVYSAVHPRRLLEIIHSREKQVKDILPELIARYNTPKEKPKIQVFKGKTGMEQLYEELYQSLNNKEEALWFTRVDALKKFFPIAIILYKRVLRRLSNPKIRELNFGNETGKAWLKETRALRNKNHHIRLLSDDFEMGFTDNLIFGNKLVIFSLKKDVFVIVIESEEIAKTYRAMFEWAWQMGTNK